MSKKKPIEQTPTKLSNAENIAALKSLQASVGWGIILGVLHENEEYLRNAILSGCDPDTEEELPPEEQNRLRDKRGLTQELMNTPATLIEAIENAEEGAEVNFDPYHDNASELSKDK